MNKQDEEKALQIALGTVGERTRNHPSNLPHIICVKDACLEMAEWKQEKMIEKAVEWMREIENGTTITNIEQLIEDFKKEMEEYE